MTPDSERAQAQASGEHWPRIGNPLSRRSFLRNGTLGAATLGVIASVPGLSGFAGWASSEAPAASDAANGAESDLSEFSGPIVAHVTDAITGDVSLYLGEREIAYRDPTLVQHLIRATR
jgi:hypothetical protein